MEIYDAVANGAVLDQNQQPQHYMDFISAFGIQSKEEAAEKEEKHATEMLMVKRKTEHRSG